MSNPNDVLKSGVPSPRDQMTARIENDFSVHHVPPSSPGAERMATIREHLRQAALVVNELVPAGREQALAITNIEQAMFWANAGIARPHPILPEDQS